MRKSVLETAVALMQDINNLTEKLAIVEGTDNAQTQQQIKEKRELLNSYLEALNKQTYHFFIGGSPGTGKSAFVGELKSAFPYAEIIASGNICRSLAKEDSERGHEIARYVKAGELVPLNLFVDVVVEKLHKILMETHVIIWDGFPRTYEQERLFSQLTIGGKVAKIIKDAPSSEIMGRIMNEGRKQCTNPSCGVEHPSSRETCTKCGSVLIVRPDDNPVIWLDRWNYHKENIAQLQTTMFADLSFISRNRESHKDIIKAIRRTWGI